MRYRKHQPTDVNRAAVKRLVLDGISQVKIAESLSIAKSTLQRYYADELKVCDRPEGRPAWNPSEDDRVDVMVLICRGFKQESIARRFGVSVDTLQLHCADEIANGYDLVRQNVELALFRRAIGSDAAPNPSAIKEFLKRGDTLPQPPAPRQQAMTPGKKAQAIADAATASEGTSWHDLLDTSQAN